jgi:uncharacterized protein with ParB-like and HNH nuclease domain
LEAGKRTINDIFNGNRVLEIPFFQRAYVWDEKQWERFLEDMEEISLYNKPYFLGSVILKQQLTNTTKSVSDIRTLIDGQQRLTTINIFFKVLCLKNNENLKFDRVFRLISSDLALVHNHNDIDNFNKIMNLKSLEDIANSSEKYNHIIGAYNYFKNNIDINKIDFTKILSNVMFVGIDLGIDEDEQQIFDTINSLGVRLTTAELLKNYFFGRDDIENYETKWKLVFENDDETKSFWDREITAGRTKRENIDLFFYSFLQIKLQDKSLNVKSDDKKRLSKFSNLFENYKSFIKEYSISKDLLIDEIKEYATIYKQNIDPDFINKEVPKDFGIERINSIIFGLDQTVIIPYILYVLKNINDEEKNKIFRYLESYLLRRMIVKATNKSYSKLFSEELILNEIKTEEEFKNLINNKTDKDNYMPSDDEVKNGFFNSKLINKQATGILYLIESKIRDRNKQSTALLGINKYSLEHLMPKKWENNWDTEKDFTEEERNYRNNKLLTLGNLAIITASLNSSIRDANWDIKKQGKGNKKGLLEYANGLETMNKYLQYDKWDENSIDKRAGFLSEKALAIWSV